MTVKYLIRLDDACPTQLRENWEMVEKIFDEFNLKPIVAVIPDCKDPTLLHDKPMENFWDLVKNWEKKGWIISIHGYQHLYTTLSDRAKSIVPIHNKTEFAGLPYEIQAEKIKKAWQIFINNEIKPKVWVAPSHTFDHDTLKALYSHTDIRVISDGFAFDIFKYNDFFFIPQQLWRFIKYPFKKPFSLFTICLHPNNMTKKEIFKLRKWFKKYSEFFIDFSQIEFTDRKYTVIEKFINDNIWFRQGFIRKIKSYLKFMK